MKKRKLSKRLLSYILCLAMVIALVPMNALTVRAEGGSNTTFEYGDYKILMLSGYIDEGDGNFSCQECGEPVFKNYNPESDYADRFSIFGVGAYKCLDCGDGMHFGITMKTPLPNASPCPHCCKGKVCSKHDNTHSYKRYDIQSVCGRPCRVNSDNEELCDYHSLERLDITCEYCRGTGIDPYFTHDHHFVYVHKVDREGINFHVSKCDYPGCDVNGDLPNSGYGCDTDGPDGACSYCGFKAEAPAHTHTKGTYHEPVVATCTNPGVVEYWDCSCGEKLDASGNVLSSIEIAATGTHDYELKDGLLQCSCCGQIQAVAPSMMSYISRSDIINSNNYIGDESEEDCSRDRTDKLKYKQIYYGKEGKKWYMLGIEDGALVLICDPSDNFGYTVYGSTRGDFDYPDSLLDEAMRKYYADTNHFSETEIGLMNEVSIYYPKAWNDPNGEQLSISRKMYAPSIIFTENIDPMSSKYIYAGKYEGSIKVRIDNKGIDTQGKYLYWTRTHSVEQSKNYLYVDSGNIDIWDLAKNDIVPVFHLNTSDILFASSAESAKANADFADAMAIRFDGTEKLTSSCTASSAQIIVNNPTEGEYLYVQWKDEKDKVKSFQPTTGKNVFTLEDGLPGDFRNCTIWLEKKVDNITYAVINDHVHSKGTHHEAVEATCTKTGNVEYWECSCGEKLDASGNVLASTEVAATGNHNFSDNGTCVCGLTQITFDITDEDERLVRVTGPNRELDMTGDLIIPSTVKVDGEDYIVNEIAGKAFEDCGFTGKLRLPNNVTKIGYSAFEGCKFTGELIIPESVTNILQAAFFDCKFTGDLTIPDSVKTIGSLAFCYAGFTGKLTIGKGLTIIDNRTFLGCGFTGDIDIPDNIKTIGKNVFEGNPINTISVPCSINISEIVWEIDSEKIIQRKHDFSDQGDGTHKCADCGATGIHDMTSYSYDESCHTPMCSACGFTSPRKYGKPFHSYSEWNNGTRSCKCGKTEVCDHSGITTGICSNCGVEFSHVKGTLHEPKPATCETDGTIEYYECAGCGLPLDGNGDEISDIVGERALGHSFTNYISNNDATCGADGTKSAKCDRCDVTDTKTDIGTATGRHNFSNSEKCTVCGTYRDSIGAKLAGYSLSLYDNIGVNFYMELAESVTKDKSAKFVMQLPDGSSKEVLVSDAKQVEVDGSAYYVFDCRVAAKEMTGVIRAHIVLGDGTEGTQYEFTVQDYVQYILDHAAQYESAVPVVKAMLNYGASAQEYFGYNTSSLANAILSDTDKKASAEPNLAAYNYASPAATDKISYVGTSLLLESEVGFKCYFESSTDLTNDNVSVKCGTETVDASRIEIGKEGNVQYIAVSGVSPAEYGQKYTVKAQDITVENVSVYGYMAKTFARSGESKELTEVLKNLYTYGEAAAEYAR